MTVHLNKADAWPYIQISICVQSCVRCYIYCQPSELRVSKSLIPMVSLDFLSLNLKGLNALKPCVIILKVYLALFVLTSSIKHKPWSFPRRKQQHISDEVSLQHKHIGLLSIKMNECLTSLNSLKHIVYIHRIKLSCFVPLLNLLKALR